MSKKSGQSILKQIKKAKAREANKLAHHLEAMGAAYCRATDIPPSRVTLMSETLKDGTRRYWYTEFTDKPNLADCHPDIQKMFDTAFALVNAHKAKDQEQVKLAIDVMAGLVDFIGAEASKDDIEAVERAKEEAEAKQNASADNVGQEEVRVSGVQ